MEGLDASMTHSSAQRVWGEVLTDLNSPRVTQTYMFPYKKDLCRFDFEVAPEDEHLCSAESFLRLSGLQTPNEGSEDK